MGKTSDTEYIPASKGSDVEQPPSKRSRGPVSNREVSSILTWRAKGLSIREIAKLSGRTKRTIERVLKANRELFETIENADKYRSTRASLLSAAEAMLLRSVGDKEAVQKAPLNQRAYTFKQVHDARRLEENKSTSNVASKVQFQSVDLSKYKPKDTSIDGND